LEGQKKKPSVKPSKAQNTDRSESFSKESKKKGLDDAKGERGGEEQ